MTVGNRTFHMLEPEKIQKMCTWSALHFTELLCTGNQICIACIYQDSPLTVQVPSRLTTLGWGYLPSCFSTWISFTVSLTSLLRSSVECIKECSCSVREVFEVNGILHTKSSEPDSKVLMIKILQKINAYRTVHGCSCHKFQLFLQIMFRLHIQRTSMTIERNEEWRTSTVTVIATLTRWWLIVIFRWKKEKRVHWVSTKSTYLGALWWQCFVWFPWMNPPLRRFSWCPCKRHHTPRGQSPLQRRCPSTERPTQDPAWVSRCTGFGQSEDWAWSQCVTAQDEFQERR